MRAFTTTMAAILLTTACASTSTKTEWKSPDLTAHKASNVLVVAMMPDEGKRRALEDAMVKSLNEKGVQAEQSWKNMPQNAMSKEAVRNLAQQQQNNGILVMRFAGVQEQVVNNGTDFDPYWGYAYPMAYGPYYTTETVVTLDSRLFAVSGEMLWSGSSQSIDPQKLDGAASSIASSVAGTLSEQGALASSGSKNNKG